MSATLWRSERPLVLASGSTARRALLQAVAIPLEITPASIDERAVESPLRNEGASPPVVAAHLAEAKALAVSRAQGGSLVLGADQTLGLGERMLTKPVDLADARRTLALLADRSHTLHSAWVLARDGVVLSAGIESAFLQMRPLSPAFIDAYVAMEGQALCASVGAYRLEGLGAHLFESIEGDHSTILGLPLFPVLSALRQLDYLLG